MSTFVKKRISNIGILVILYVICGIMLFGVSGIAKAEETAPTSISSPIVTSPPKNSIISGNYEYRIINEFRKQASLTKVHNYGEEVELPSVIDGYNIVSIGISYDDQNISDEHGYRSIIMPIFSEEDTIVKKLIIPEGVVLIETNAFYKMKNLETLVLPDSLKEIKENNFMKAGNIKTLTFSNEIYIWDNCFRDSVIGKLTINGSILTGAEDDDDASLCGMGGTIKQLIVNNKNKQKRTILNLGRAHINNMVVGSSVKSIVLDGKYDNIKLKNSKTKIGYEEGCAQIYKMTAMISKIKVKKKSARYVYSWAPMKIEMSYWRMDGGGIKNMKSKVKYRVQQKNRANRYKTFKTTKKAKIKLKSKSKIKVEAVFSNDV